MTRSNRIWTMLALTILAMSLIAWLALTVASSEIRSDGQIQSGRIMNR